MNCAAGPGMLLALACTDVFGALEAAEPQEVAFPTPLAFNGGLVSKEAMDEARGAGVADVEYEGNVQIVQHIRIEVHQGSQSGDRDQVTFFGVCRSRFVPTVSGRRMLSRVEAEFVALDAFGRPIGRTTWEVTVKDRGNRKWVQQTKPARPIKQFYEGLAPWAKMKLQVLTGFLYKNPGDPPVAWEKTKEERVAAFLGNMLELAPGPAKQVALEVAENLIKKASIEALEEAFRSKELRWGADVDLRSEKIERFADECQKKGAVLWLKHTK